MTFANSIYWLVYVPESTPSVPRELVAIAPAIVDRSPLCRDARVALAVADLYHCENSNATVVFVADLTAWLAAEKDSEWGDLDVDIYDAMAAFDRHVPNVVLSANPITLAVAIRGRARFDVLVPGWPVMNAADHDEAVRADILHVILAFLDERRSAAQVNG